MNPTREIPAAEAAPRLPLALGLVLFGAIALFGNAVALWLRYPNLGAAVLFPPYAALTTAFLFSPRRHWVWYVLVGAVAHAIPFVSEFSLSWMVVADIANVTRALVAAVLLRRLFRGPPRLDDMRSLGLFIAVAVIAAPAVGASIGALNVVLHDAQTTYGRVWVGWFLSNALTGLVVLPMLVAAVEQLRPGGHRIDRRRALEAAIVAIALGVASGFAFLLPARAGSDLALRFLGPLPVLIWAALRFSAGGACLALTVVAGAAIWGADRGTGPFLASAPDENVLTLQLFLLLTTMQILSIAAIARGRHRAVRLYNALLTSLPEQVAVLDRGGVVLAVNESWRRLDDRPSDRYFGEVGVGDNYLAACHAAEGDGDPTAERVRTGVQSVLELTSRRFEMEYERERNGRRQWYAISAHALERADGGAVVTRTDVSARHEAESEIESQRRELSHLARVAVLGQLSGALAHELRQPLASILSNAEAARLVLKRDPPDVGEIDAILADIVAEDQRASEVMGRLRALLRRGDTPLQPVDANELVREVLDLARAELITRRVTASALVAPTITPVLGNRVQLQQVLLNLILNACEAMMEIPPDERRLALTVRTTPPNDVQVSVRDSGTGFPVELGDRVFEPFVTSKPEGLGLGLSISRTIVAAHGGRLWAETNAEPGATVHVVLPAAERITVSHERPGEPAIAAPMAALPRA